jgi:hypothetical protein
MAESFDFEKEPRQDKLSSLVAKEIRRVLAQYDEVIEAHTSTPAHMSAGNDLPSLTRKRAVHDDLTALASEFVHRLAAEAARDFSAGAREGVPLTVRTEGAHGSAVQKTRDQQSDCLGIQDWAGQVAGPTYLEKRFGIPRSTLHWWQRQNDVVALRKGARKHVFPLAQFIDGRPAPGIRQVLASISNPRLAWFWLIRPSPLLDGRVPIEMLRQDLAEEVVLAARDFSLT